MSLVSIVIPAYNVEQFLRSCLESIRDQSHQDFQVVVVDDESSDATPYIAGQFAEQDSRFQHVRQANRGPGPGGGRNGGLPHVEGEWIFFLDGDDLITPNAISLLLEAGTRTGSDIVTGNVGRFRSGGLVWPTPNHARSHQVSLDDTHITRHPILAYDTTAWNKLYRTEFWNGAGRVFPERKLFEDIDPITRAHCESSGTDVVTDQVYLWRIRDDQTSITQQVADERTFRDKIEQMTLAHTYLCDHGYTEVRAVFEEKSLTRDFSQGVDEIGAGDDSYAKMVCTQGAEFLDRMMPASLEQLPVRDQLKFHLVREGRIDDLRDLVTGGYDDATCTIDRASQRVINDFASTLQPAVPERLTVSEDRPELKLSRVRLSWDDEAFTIHATASVDGLGGRLGRVRDLRLWYTDRSRRHEIAIDTESPVAGGLVGVLDRLVLDRERRSVRPAPFGRFAARVPFADLEPSPSADVVQWRFYISGSADGIERTNGLPVLADDRLPAEHSRRIGNLLYEIVVLDDGVALRVKRVS